MSLVIDALWLIFPAYTANAFAVVVKGRRPLDSGRYFGMQRLLGDGKTIEGTAAGVACGILVGMLQLYLQPYVQQSMLTLPLVVLLSIGAITGDILASFLKRRLGMPRGKSFFPLDQLDFVIGALALSSFVYAYDYRIVIILLLVTPPIHYLTNVIGYMLRFKKTPW